MIKAFFASKKWFWWAYGGGLLLLLLLYAQVSMSVKMNTWYKGFYDILQQIEKHTFVEFRQKIIDFSWIAIPWTIFAVVTNYATRRYSLWWREAITFNYIPRWRNVKQEIEGSSQRIQEDAYRFARIVETLGLQVARAIMTLVAFLPILWILSKIGITVPFVGTSWGKMAWFLFMGPYALFLTNKVAKTKINWNVIKDLLCSVKILGKMLEWIPVRMLPTDIKIKFVYVLRHKALKTKNILRIFWVAVVATLPRVWWLRIVKISTKTLNWTDKNALTFTVVVIATVGTLWKLNVYQGMAGWLFCAGLLLAYMFPAKLAKKFKLAEIDSFSQWWARFWLINGVMNSVSLFLAWYACGALNQGLPSLVWVAIFISFSGTVISWFVGIKLPGLEYNNQKVEAAFRKELVLGEDDKTNHASLPTLAEMFTGIKFNYQRLFWHYGYFDLWSNLFNQIMVVVPFLIAGPALFSGIITLGILIQIDNAFGKVLNSFSLFLENWTTVTELRSIKKRLKEFEVNLDMHVS